MIALIGTPSGDSQSGSIVGHCARGRRKAPIGMRGRCSRLLANRPASSARRASPGIRRRLVRHPLPPHAAIRRQRHIGKDGVLRSVAIAVGLVFALVPGATPKNPASGLMPRRIPFASGRLRRRQQRRWPGSKKAVLVQHREVFPGFLKNLFLYQSIGCRRLTAHASPPAHSKSRLGGDEAQGQIQERLDFDARISGLAISGDVKRIELERPPASVACRPPSL